ncbi:MAG: SRPBCC domain-containing protein [Nakamurella sp.]
MTPADLPRPELQPDGDNWVVVIERTLAHPPEQVWNALTVAEDLRQWAPFSPDRDLTAAGPVQLTDRGVANPGTHPGNIEQAIPPRLLVMAWGDDLLRWELVPDSAGTLLTLRHRFVDKPWVGSYVAGWHLCLAALAALLNGHPTPSVVGDNAREHGYQELADGYAELLGVPLPEQQTAR